MPHGKHRRIARRKDGQAYAAFERGDGACMKKKSNPEQQNPRPEPIVPADGRQKTGFKISLILALLAVLTAIALGVILKFTADVFVPLVIAWFLSQISSPIIMLGARLRLPHVVSVALVFIAIFLLCLFGATFARSQLANSERIFSMYGPKLNELINKGLETLQVPSESFSIMTILRRYIGSISSGVLSFTNQFFMTLVFLVFILLDVPVWDRKLDRAFSGPNAAKIKNIFESISKQTSRYLATMVLVSLLTGFCVWGALAIIGVDFAAFWGVVAFILNFIPTIGSIIATIPPVLMALLQFSPSLTEPIVTLAVLGAIQMITGNVLAPKLFGDSLGLSTVVIMLSLLLWSMILGIPGAILSVPIAAIIKIVCENVPSLRPIAVMMGTGREKTPAGERK